MHVITLDRVVHEAEAATLPSGAKALLESVHEPSKAERRNVPPHLQRDVARMPRRERRTAAVRVTTHDPGLAAGALPPSAPAIALLQSEFELSRSSHHRDPQTPPRFTGSHRLGSPPRQSKSCALRRITDRWRSGGRAAQSPASSLPTDPLLRSLQRRRGHPVRRRACTRARPRRPSPSNDVPPNSSAQVDGSGIAAAAIPAPATSSNRN